MIRLIKAIKRRQLLWLLVAATAIVAAPAVVLAEDKTSKPLLEWKGRAFGTNVSITCFHPNENEVQDAIENSIIEIERLENIFSLYRENSEISKLNRNGELKNPSPEMIELVSLAKYYGQKTAGAFELTLQPFWQALKSPDHSAALLQQALKKVNYRNVVIEPTHIYFKEKGMAISLNGIAQGYITDKISQILLSKGITNALVNLGEIRAFGNKQNNKPWQVAVKHPTTENTFGNIKLQNMSISTSGGYGTAINFDGVKHHIINPQTGKSAQLYQSLSVIADSATKADALSTAFYIQELDAIKKIIYNMPEVSVLILHNNGTIQKIGRYWDV